MQSLKNGENPKTNPNCKDKIQENRNTSFDITAS